MDINEWDIEVVRDLFNEREAELILSIPLSDSIDIDGWMWCLEKSGLYSQKCV